LEGDWDKAKIEAYLDQWHNRFDLFDAQRPFYQSPGFREGKPITINKLFNEMSATNNTVLFDHRFDDMEPRIEASYVARGLVTAQAYALGGGRSATINLVHAPLVGKAMVMLKGRNLFETLSLNLLPMGTSSPISLTGEASDKQLNADRPIWESDKLDRPGSTRPIRGYLDLLTWQSRAINLLPSEKGSMTFSSMFMAQGTMWKNDDLFDPMVAYYQSKDYGWRPVGVDMDKEPWRSLAALVHTTTENKGTMNVNSVGTLIRDGAISRDALYHLEVFGMCSSQAKIHQWKHARIPFPLSYLKDENLVPYLTDAITIAEKIEHNLKKGIRELATQILYPIPGMKPDKNVVNRMVDSFKAVPRYWSVLEVPFYSLINELAESSSKGLDREDKILLKWAEITVRCAADDSLNEQIDAVANEARGMKASVMARQAYSISMAQTINEIRRKYNE
jgi:CRISPR system Cascade subunit CasA